MSRTGESRASCAAFAGVLLAAALAGCGAVRLPASAEAERVCAKIAREVEDGAVVATVAAAFDTDLAGLRRVALRTGPQDPDVEDDMDRWGVADPATRAIVCYIDGALQDGAQVERLVVGSILPAAGNPIAFEVIRSGRPDELPAAMP